MSIGHLIEMPNGDRLFFDDSLDEEGEPKHDYYAARPAKLLKDGVTFAKPDRDRNVDGWCRSKRLTGVTSVVKPLDFRPDKLMGWAVRLTLEGVAELASTAIAADDEHLESWMCTGEVLAQALQDAGLTWQQIRDQRGVVGTNVHERTLQALASGEAVPDYEGLTEEEKGYSAGIVQFWLDHAPKVHQVEQVVYLARLGVAGRFDLRAELAKCDAPLCPCQQGGTGMIDAKTGSYISEGAHAQVAGYKGMAAECGFGESGWGGILQVDAEGGYRLFNTEATFEDFEVSVDTYRRASKIGSKAKKAREVRDG